jgi:hypothetical protein
VSTLLVDQLEMPVGAWRQHALSAAGERCGELLAERTVWCVTSAPGATRAAEELRARIDGAAPGASAVTLPLSGDEPLRDGAAQLEAILCADPAPATDLDPDCQDAYAHAAATAEQLLGAPVARGDVVVVDGALGAVVIAAARERGAHTVWRFGAPASRQASSRRARELAHELAPAVDAYLLAWRGLGVDGEVYESVAVAMPATGMLAAKRVPARFRGEGPRRLAWRMALAEVVRSDRDEHVGGRLHARPAVAAR